MRLLRRKPSLILALRACRIWAKLLRLAKLRRLGELTAGGKTLDEALAVLGETAEGADTIPAALRLAGDLGVQMPITEGLHDVFVGGVSWADAIATLMEREPTTELAAAD